MCCGVPEDVYDLVVVANSEHQIGDAFAAAFVGREQEQRVAVVLPHSQAVLANVQRLREALSLSEIGLLVGRVTRDADPHYLDVDGRLVYGDSVMALAQ